MDRTPNQLITVVPLQVGWAVRMEPGGDAVVFSSGAKAEAAARRLGRAVETSGASAEVLIRLRDGAVAGRVHYGARPEATG